MIFLLDKYWFPSVKSAQRYYAILEAYIQRILEIIVHILLFFLNLISILLIIFRCEGFATNLVTRIIRYVETWKGGSSQEAISLSFVLDS